MDSLVAKSACDGMLPLTIGGTSLTEDAPDFMTSVSPYVGKTKATSESLKTAHGMAFPAPNRATGKTGARAVWIGHGQAMLIGPAPDAALAEMAALTDQSDAWTVVRLEGAHVVEVLARLVPVDFRAPAFKRGHTVRSQLMHMAVSVTKVGENAFQIMAFRSMAQTLVHDLKSAMEAVAARG